MSTTPTVAVSLRPYSARAVRRPIASDSGTDGERLIVPGRDATIVAGDAPDTRPAAPDRLGSLRPAAGKGCR
jgi:hypothetical protein